MKRDLELEHIQAQFPGAIHDVIPSPVNIVRCEVKKDNQGLRELARAPGLKTLAGPPSPGPLPRSPPSQAPPPERKTISSNLDKSFYKTYYKHVKMTHMACKYINLTIKH